MTELVHSRAIAVAILTLAGVAAPRRVEAQGPPGGRCDLVFDPLPATRVNAQRIGEGQVYNYFFGGAFNARCAGQDIRLTADSDITVN